MGKRLYVGNLAWAADEAKLTDLFSEAGTVEKASVVTDKATGKSRGFGFVEMSTDEEAQKAIEMLNEKSLEGRNINVSEAKPMKERY